MLTKPLIVVSMVKFGFWHAQLSEQAKVNSNPKFLSVLCFYSSNIKKSKLNLISVILTTGCIV